MCGFSERRYIQKYNFALLIVLIKLIEKFLLLIFQAALGIANLCVRAMQTEGTSIAEARKKIWMMDIDGLLAIGRPEGRLEGQLFENKFYIF